MMGRAMTYCFLIVSNINVRQPNTEQNEFYSLYDGYDFRGNANKLQIYISFIFMSSCFIAIIAGCLHYLFQLLS